MYDRRRLSFFFLFFLTLRRTLCFCNNRRELGSEHEDVRERGGHASGPLDKHVLRLRLRATGDRESPSFPHGGIWVMWDMGLVFFFQCLLLSCLVLCCAVLC